MNNTDEYLVLSFNKNEEIHKAGKKQPEHYCLHFSDFLDFLLLAKTIQLY